MTTKNGNRPAPARTVSKEAEQLATAIDNLIMARIEHMHSPGTGPEAAEDRHTDLTEELKRVL